MMSSHYQQATFLLSVADIQQLPKDIGSEVAIVGRSNAGKSTVLNQITRQKSLARVSKTPGRTQLLNFFAIADAKRLVDLPGYGYAKVPPATKAKWQQTIDAYFQGRQSLKGLLLIMDSRHPMKPLDEQLIAYCAHRDLPVHILLNKADKLSRNEQQKVLLGVRQTLRSYHQVTAQLFSGLTGLGLQALCGVLDGWYGWGA